MGASKLDSQEYVLDESNYLARIQSKESATHAKDIFVNRYFALNKKGLCTENKIMIFFKNE